MTISPTRRSLLWLRHHGYTVFITEHWNGFAEIRQDLLGFIDLIALRPNAKGILGVQTTGGQSNFAARVKKVTQSRHATLWLQTGNQIQVHGWVQNGVRKPWRLLIEGWGDDATTHQRLES